MSGMRHAMSAVDVAGWSEVLPGKIERDCLQPLSKKRKTAVYRIAGAGHRGSAVIAKLCPAASGKVERAIYEHILPELPLTAPHYYGAFEADGGGLWILLEDVTGVRYSPLIDQHRVLAGRWLGLLHTAASALRTRVPLPERGSDHYLACLGSARELILAGLRRPALAGEVAVLAAIIRQCDVIESSWARIEQLCASVPETLTHGDFRPKNVFVLGDPAPRLLPLDWELAGWGFPGIDIASARPLPVESLIDLDAYAEIVRRDTPDLDSTAIARQARLGMLFRRITAIHWATLSLAGEWWKKRLEYLSIYHADLEALLKDPPWNR